MENKILCRFEPYINEYMVMCDGQFYAINKADWPKVVEDLGNYDLIEYEDFPLNSFSFPLKVQIQATPHCNLACKTCAAFKEERRVALSTEELKEIIDKLARFGVLNLEWSGGEPFLRKDLFLLAEYAGKKGLKQNILTNGMFFSEKNIEIVKKLFYKVQVSIDDIGENFNNIVGKNAWNDFVKSLRAATSNNLNLQVATVLQEKNVNHFQSILKFCGDMKIKKIRIAMEIPLGRSDNTDWKKYTKVIDTFSEEWPLLKAEARKRNISIDCFLDKHVCANKDPLSLVSPGGYSFLYIDSRGDVYPFPFLSQPEFFIGSVFKNDLRELWLSSNILNNIRKINNKVVGCDCGMECAFADRYLVYAYRGDISGAAMPYKNCVLLSKNNDLSKGGV